MGWWKNRRQAEGSPDALWVGEAYRIVEMIARDEPLELVLGELARMLEQRSPTAACAIPVLRDGRLYNAAAPSLPEGYSPAMDGLTIEEAPYWSRSPALIDIEADARWAGFRSLFPRHNLRCCHSLPIMSGAGEILGALVMYEPTFRQPGELEIESFKLTGRLAGIAIEHRNLTDELAYQAHHDPLTKLPNRRLFEDRLRQAVAVAQRYGKMAAVLALDLDRFKLVNDLLGYAVGDTLLERISRRLVDRLRRSDSLARSGGDEFTILLPSVTAEEAVEKLAWDLLQTLSPPFQVGEHELFVSASIGISIYPQDGADAAALERNATSAMYAAKRCGRNNVKRFVPQMSSGSADLLELEAHLRRALSQGEFFLEYQPQVELDTFRVCGVEALIRWKHPHLGVISPGTFIPMAEESGVIIPIGSWVLEQACRQAQEWRQAGHEAIRVGVNVSALQLTRPEFVQSVGEVLSRTGLDPQLLELELTESLVMSDIGEAASRMSELRALGTRIAIDDFGTGHSSLSYLQTLPTDTIKIDRSFVRDLKDPLDAPPLVQAIISLAHRLGKNVIAEGVETERQVKALRRMECDEAQGFLFGRTWSPASEMPTVPATVRS